jgi:hypothetical protein
MNVPAPRRPRIARTWAVNLTAIGGMPLAVLGAQHLPWAAAPGSSITVAMMVFTLSYIRERHRHEEALLDLKLSAIPGAEESDMGSRRRHAIKSCSRS